MIGATADNFLHQAMQATHEVEGGRNELFSLLSEKTKHAEFLNMSFAIAGLAFAIAEMFLSMEEPSHQRHIWKKVLLSIVFILWLFSLVCWYRLYDSMTQVRFVSCLKSAKNKRELMREFRSISSGPLSWYRQGMFWRAVGDFLTLLPQPWLTMRHHRIQFGGFGGGVPQTYSVNSIFVFLMLFRLAFIPRYLARTSRLYSFSARAVSNMNHVVVNWKLVARLFLSSTAVVSAIFFIFAAVFGMMFLVAEHPMGPSSLLYNNYQNGVWLSFITMTTVGYGDSYPQTELGRGVAIAAAFASMIATALFVGTVRCDRGGHDVG